MSLLEFHTSPEMYALYEASSASTELDRVLDNIRRHRSTGRYLTVQRARQFCLLLKSTKNFINHEIHMNCYGQLATIQTTDTLNSDTLFRLAQALQAWEQQNR